MIHGSGFGKVILFGEHFVVHGQPAIVASLPYTTTATITLNPGQPLQLIDRRPFAPGVTYSSEKEIDYLIMAQRIIEYFDITNQCSITLAGTLAVTNGGIGASAAAAVSIATAINNYFSLGYTQEQIYAAALHGEKAIHGNPSGIDVAAALCGGITYFVKNALSRNRPFIKPLTPATPLFLVIIDSGQRCAIKEVLNDVATLRTSRPALFTSLCTAYNDLVSRARMALCTSDTKKLGLLMLENQQRLESLSVSHASIDVIVKQSLDLGAYGAKLTGTGRGGLVIALAPNKDVQRSIVRFFKQRANHVMEATLQNPSSPENGALKFPHLTFPPFEGTFLAK